MPSSNQPESKRLGIIGGSGFYQLGLGPQIAIHQVDTPFQSIVTIAEEQLALGTVLFLPRHGAQHTIAPHHINYRANVWALQSLGVDRLIAINAVGGISPGLTSGRLVIPDQLIDYTYGREQTCFDGVFAPLQHIDFTLPYDADLSRILGKSAQAVGAEWRLGGVYGCTQGPRLETAAEIERMARDGCDIVGMTAMPEAALARELGIRYASLCLVVNRAAGRGDGEISMDAIKQVMTQGSAKIRKLLATVCEQL